MNKIRKVYDMLLRLDIMQRARGSLTLSFSSTFTFLAKQQVVSQRTTSNVLSAKNSDISDNSTVHLSYRERLQDGVAVAKFYMCLYLRCASTRRFTLMHTTVQMHFAIRYSRTRTAICNSIICFPPVPRLI